MLTQAQIATEWGPACSGPSATVTLYGGGRVTVAPAIVDAVKALDAVLRRHSYATRAADTGAYSCRRKTGGTGWSNHSYKIALDLNWRTNPYGGRLVTDMPRAMVDDILAIRTNSNAQVWSWGGDWRGNKDAMHYEIVCRRADIATGIRGATAPPNDLAAALAKAKMQVLGDKRDNPLWAMAFLRAGLRRVTGRDLATEGPWDPFVAQTVIDLQRWTGQNELGFVGPKTWRLLFP